MLTARKLTPAEQRQYDTQIEEERNGAPIPKDIAARMTKPKVLQPLFQVKADVKNDQDRVETLAVGPKMGLDAAEEILIAVNGQISLGKLPGWRNARLEPVHNT